MVNKVILLGNVGNEPDIKMLPSGGKVANLSIATSDSWRDKEGNKQVRTEWHRITVFNESLIKIIEQYVHKGSQLYIEGSSRTRKYTDSSGVDKYTTEIVIQNYSDTIRMVGSNSKQEEGVDPYNPGTEPSKIPQQSEAVTADMDDEIPF